MNEKKVVDILLGTYNGEKYLPALLASLESQSYKDWNLIIRDDCSRDNTKNIIFDFKSKYPDKVKIIDDEGKNLGACKNFLKLLEFSKSDYLLFCDQDDVWLPEKIERMLNRALEIERHISNQPFLIHHDLIVVDESLNIISESFWKYQFIRPDFCKTLPRLLVTNSVTGCATLINKKLKELIIPAPEGVIMHDWWIALVASAFGEIYWMPDRLVLYRQHGKNDVGAKAWNLTYVIKKAITFYNREALLKGFRDTIKQAKVFYDRYQNNLKESDKLIIEKYVNLLNENFIRRRLNIVKYGFLRTGLIRNLGFLLRV
ncbi:MAG: glycosyltransferase family 2 protein [Proteobacteria bacterium]|nr:glycosyltransferase family 2 protein [Pseudomonadota bacterium]